VEVNSKEITTGVEIQVEDVAREDNNTEEGKEGTHPRECNMHRMVRLFQETME